MSVIVCVIVSLLYLVYFYFLCLFFLLLCSFVTSHPRGSRAVRLPRPRGRAYLADDVEPCHEVSLDPVSETNYAWILWEMSYEGSDEEV
jgi:hypothetical protein